MTDLFESDFISFIFTVVVAVLAVFFLFLLIRSLILRLRNKQSYGRQREKEQGMESQRRKAKPSSKLPLSSDVISEFGGNYATKPVESVWTRMSNTLRTLTGSQPPPAAAGKQVALRESQDDYESEPGKEAFDTTAEAVNLRDILRKLNEISAAVATLTKQSDSYQEVFAGELSEIRRLLKGAAGRETPRHSSERSAGGRASHQGSFQRAQHPESRSAHWNESPLEALCRLYNASAGDQNKQQEFKQTYSPIRIGATNYMECARDPNISPEFGEKSDGNFEAIGTNTSGIYLVVPRFTLVVQDAQYGPGAVGIVFNCRNYTPGKTYRRIELINPATFSTDGENWKMVNPGELLLS